MSRWLALGEPVVRVTVRLPRVRSKDERLRERAEAHARLSLEKFYSDKDLRSQWSQYSRLQVRTSTLVAERRAVLKQMSSIPRHRVFLRRKVFKQTLEENWIAKWW